MLASPLRSRRQERCRVTVLPFRPRLRTHEERRAAVKLPALAPPPASPPPAGTAGEGRRKPPVGAAPLCIHVWAQGHIGHFARQGPHV